MFVLWLWVVCLREAECFAPSTDEGELDVGVLSLFPISIRPVMGDRHQSGLRTIPPCLSGGHCCNYQYGHRVAAYFRATTRFANWGEPESARAARDKASGRQTRAIERPPPDFKRPEAAGCSQVFLQGEVALVRSLKVA